MIIYRGNAEFLTIEVDNQTILKQELLGEDVVQSNFSLEFYYEFKIGDYINWRGKKYTIFKQPEVDKSKTNDIKYSLEFGSDQYRLLNALFFLDNNSEFYLVGDLEKFANLLIVNLNRLAGENYYSLGSYPVTEVKNMSFSNSNCLLVLQQICSEFGKEFQFSPDGTTINFYDKIGVDTGLTFRFKQGLRNIKRKKISDRNLVTRLYAFGGERNITHDYGSKRLKIGAIENNVGIFGVIEGVVTFDEVYPHRAGTVTSIDGNILRFFDSSMDFDINDQLMPGVTAKVTFNTGDLSGYEFEIQSYDDVTKRFQIIEYEDETGLILPNATLKAEFGDEYVIHDIIMPQTYIDAAESELLTKATAYLHDNSLPNAVYDVIPHYPYLRKNLIQLNVGDIVTITDDDFGITFQTRILNITQSLANPYLYSIKVGDKVTVNYITKVLSNQKELDNSIRIERTDRTADYNRIRRNLRNIDELRDSIFDPEGYFDPTHIKPLSIETSMLSVGNKSQQFLIRELLIEANYQADPNKTNIGNGVLVHFVIEDTIREWNLSGSVKTHAESNQYYYIYARCNRSGSTGDFLTTSVQYKVDAGSTYYYFLIGVIHSVVDGVRGISLTYGQTTINGKFITTGRVQSIDGINYFDLDTGQFFVGDSNSSLDWNVTNPNKLTLKGSLVQSDSGDVFPLPVYRGDYSASTTYYQGDQVLYNDSVYMMIHANPQINKVPTNTTYWKLYAAGGSGADGVDGTSIIFKGTYSSHPLSPQNGWAYYNSTDNKSYVRQDGVWYQMTIDGVDGNDGISISWRGDSATPPSSPQLNWVYRDTDNGLVYIYNGAAWTLMVRDGDDGANGTNGTNGLNVYITYHDNALTSPPSTPTGNGTTGGWTTVSAATRNWMSQKVAASSTSGTWGTPIRIKGLDGANGTNGSTGPSMVYRGIHSGSTVYYNNSLRRDVVKYGSTYYMYSGTNGVALAWNAANWQSFGASFTSVATDLLLAESATIADWVINNGKISSQSSFGVNPKTVLDGTAGAITLQDGVDVYGTTGALTSNVPFNIDLSPAQNGMKIVRNSAGGQPSARVEIKTDHIYIDSAAPRGGGDVYDGRRIAIESKVRAYQRLSAGFERIVAVHGEAINLETTNPAPTYGGWFEHIFFSGLHQNTYTRTVSGTYYCTESDLFISCGHVSGTVNIYLPSTKYQGRTILVKRKNSSVTVFGNGTNIRRHDNNSSISIAEGDMWIFMYDGTEWTGNVFTR